MLIRKNKTTNLIWIIFVILTLGTLLVTSMGVAELYNKKNDILYVGISYFAILIGAFLVYLLSLFFKKAGVFDAIKNTKFSVLYQVLYLIFVSTLVVMVRFIYIFVNDINSISDISCYTMAVNSSFNQAASISPLNYLYVRFLTYLFKMTGSSLEICIYTNVAFHLIVFLATYFSLKYLISTFAAISGSLAYALIPFNINSIFDISPSNFIVAIFAISLLLIIYSCNYACSYKLTAKYNLLFFGFSGIFAGIFAFMDLSGICFLLSGIFMIFYAARNREIIDKIYKPINEAMIYVLAAIVAFVLSYFLMSQQVGNNIVDLIVSNYNFSWYQFNINYFISTPAYGSLYSAVLTGFSFIWLFKIFSIERDYASPIILFAVQLALLSLLSLEKNSYEFVITYCYLYLAIFGIASLTENTNIAENDLDNNTESDAEKKQLDKEALKQRKKEEKIKLKQMKKEARMAKKNNNSGINTTLTSSGEYLTEAEANLDFLKEQRIQKEQQIKESANKESANIESFKMESTDQEIKEKDTTTNNISEPVQLDFVAKSISDTSNMANTSVEESVAESVAKTPMESVTKSSTELLTNSSIESGTNDKTVTDKIEDKKYVTMNPYGKRMDYKTAVVKASSNSPSSLHINNIVSKTEFIKNPLPTPKKHISREMDFDVIPAESDMHFDIVDLKGKDFFDIN